MDLERLYLQRIGEQAANATQEIVHLQAMLQQAQEQVANLQSDKTSLEARLAAMSSEGDDASVGEA